MEKRPKVILLFKEIHTHGRRDAGYRQRPSQVDFHK